MDDPTLNISLFMEKVKKISPSTVILVCSSFSVDAEEYKERAEVLEKPFDEKVVREKLASHKMIL